MMSFVAQLDTDLRHGDKIESRMFWPTMELCQWRSQVNNSAY